ncbi:MAG: beta-N-acetylhexosaminidase [Beggiatoa sp.]|nr:beta-N-acetylhexosaminidase [Beggiatoa sp.]
MPGQVMLDLLGTEPSAEEQELLLHPQCCGVILFTRNYIDPHQITALCRKLHALKRPPLLIAVDHEGGPVQRFRAGFTPLPPCAALGRLHDRDPLEARRMAYLCGFVMAAELRAVGVDLSFAPVLDLGLGQNAVIGERAFHRDPETVVDLASAYIAGMREAGMAAVGKHFPGHGSVGGDSHIEIPINDRPYADRRRVPAATPIGPEPPSRRAAICSWSATIHRARQRSFRPFPASDSRDPRPRPVGSTGMPCRMSTGRTAR